MSTVPKPRVSPEQYLDRERKAEFKSEYLNGEIFAMAGASEAHNLIVTNLLGELRTQLKGRPCKTYPSDMKVAVGPSGLFTYPDVSVVCGDAEFHDGHRDVLLNPGVIVEVLSPSTEAYDRGAKFLQYQRTESLSEYLMVATEERRVEQYSRREDGQWLYSETHDAADSVVIPSLNCTLAMGEIYDRVIFKD